MKITRTGRISAIVATAAVAALALSSCASNEAAAPVASVSTLTGTLVGAGASSQDSAQKAWTAAFQIANPKVTINYDPTGSGAGRKTFIAGGSAFAGTDSSLSTDELAAPFAACTAGTLPFEVPAYISPIAVIFNVAGVTELNLDASTLAKIFSGAITVWNDPAIVALNPKATMPSTAITAVHRSDDSGTTKNFSDYLFQTAKADWAIDKPADPFPFATGEGAKGTSGVVDAVKNGVGTIGYADASKAGKLGVAKIKVGDKFVGYTAEAAAAVVAGSPAVAGRDATDMAIKINRTTTDPTHYPIVLVSYLIGCNSYVDATSAPLVKAYFDYILSDAGQMDAATNAGSAPLAAAVSEKALAIVNAIK
ncbi:phosphate ABC transporter substrate-binding protein PstS [Alpinimonas psychrophila]|uniref:Phosphate-binding protein n=1 Tax=Alpinimonas psychrophila TaxID=748908 RepID=A0A7W3JRN0_9MICO|nr:phosphate transport system substrate-binding protein [Alpinimonas psychrophila]